MASSLFSLSGKIALLTGAVGFFGRHFARALLECGAATVILIDRKKEELGAFAKELAATFGNGKTIAFDMDLYDHEAAGRQYQIISKTYAVDVLVNNAFDFSPKTGFNVPEGRLEHTTYDQLRAAFDAGFYWAFQTTQIFGLAMKQRGAGSIVNIGTMYAEFVPNPSLYEGTSQFNPPGYSMAKGGLLQFTCYAAAWLAPQVRVNMLSPGAFPHPPSGTHNPASEVVLERLGRKVLLGRMGNPQDLVGALIYLASDASGYVTGQNLCVDGGITVTVT